MKVINYTGIFLAASLAALSARAEDVTNRFSFSARVGFNISAKFKGQATSSLRKTPDGASYNYDDGYILTDSSDNFGGMTWNWGYDKDTQIDSGNDTVALSRSLGSSSSRSLDDDLSPGGELIYNRQLGAREHFRYGLEIAGNFLNLGLDGGQKSSGSRVTDLYSYFSGTTPPGVAPGNPYQGTFTGPGFVIFTNIASSVTNAITIANRQKLDANLWGLRFGPYLEFPISETINLGLNGGLAVGFLDTEVSWEQNATVVGSKSSASGHGQDFAVLWGGYLGANLSWQFAKGWSLIGGVQYQTLGTYQHSFAGQKVEVDLSRSIFVTLGIGYNF